MAELRWTIQLVKKRKYKAYLLHTARPSIITIIHLYPAIAVDNKRTRKQLPKFLFTCPPLVSTQLCTMAACRQSSRRVKMVLRALVSIGRLACGLPCGLWKWACALARRRRFRRTVRYCKIRTVRISGPNMCVVIWRMKERESTTNSLSYLYYRRCWFVEKIS